MTSHCTHVEAQAHRAPHCLTGPANTVTHLDSTAGASTATIGAAPAITGRTAVPGAADSSLLIGRELAAARRPQRAGLRPGAELDSSYLPGRTTTTGHFAW